MTTKYDARLAYECYRSLIADLRRPGNGDRGELGEVCGLRFGLDCGGWVRVWTAESECAHTLAVFNPRWSAHEMAANIIRAGWHRRAS